MHAQAVTAAGAALIHFARSCGPIRGEWIAIDGSKFRAVASIDSVCERVALQRYLDNVEKADAAQETEIDQSGVRAALENLKNNAEPEAGFMLVRQQALPAYNIQTAVDTENALIVAHAVVLDASDTFRATGITAYLKNGGRLEIAQQMAAHESARTTGLYDRRSDEVSLDEVERIGI